MAVKLDELDIRIIDALSADVRTPLRTIGHQTGVSIDTVKSRIGRMTDRGIIRLVGMIDPAYLGLNTIATAALEFVGSLADITQQLRRYPQIAFLASTLHEYSLVAEIACADDETLIGLVGSITEVCPALSRIKVWKHLHVVKWDTRYRKVSPTPQPVVSDSTLDSTDRALLAELVQDPRATASRLSAQLGISYAATQRRLQHLLGMGALVGVVVHNRSFLPEKCAALLGIRARGNLVAVAQDLARIPSIEILVRSSGSFQFLAEVGAPDITTLVSIVDHSVYAIEGIDHVDLRPYSAVHILPAPWKFQTDASISARKEADATVDP